MKLPRIFLKQRLSDLTDIERGLADFLLSDKPAIVYGAGNQAKILLDLCRFFDKNVASIVTTTGSEPPVLFHSAVPILPVSQLAARDLERDYDIIIAVGAKHTPEIRGILQKVGITQPFFSLNWPVFNKKIRDCWYDAYFIYNGAHFLTDAAGKRFVEYETDGKTWRFPFPEHMNAMKINLISELYDNVFPSIFHDISYVSEGPYEHGAVVLRHGDVVFDLGASMGLFSSVAASKGCQVYAFEPGPESVAMLMENLSTYQGITICPYAVSDQSGKAVFHTNAANANESLTRSSLLVSVGQDTRLEIDAVSLDELPRKCQSCKRIHNRTM